MARKPLKDTTGLIKNQVSSELKKSASNMNIKRDQNNIKTHSLNIRVVLQNAMQST